MLSNIIDSLLFTKIIHVFHLSPTKENMANIAFYITHTGLSTVYLCNCSTKFAVT